MAATHCQRSREGSSLTWFAAESSRQWTLGLSPALCDHTGRERVVAKLLTHNCILVKSVAAILLQLQLS